MGQAALRVKICGITKPDQGHAIAEAGASMLGFICVPVSPRYVTPAQIAQVVATLPLSPDTGRPGCECVGVFVNASLEVIQETVAIAQLTGVQLHGDESPEFCRQLKQLLPDLELIKALRIPSAEALNQANLYDQAVDTLLLDAYHPTLSGGTGKTIDWGSLQHFQPTRPWLLAGGLTPDNVLEALQLTHPTGIDLSSGVELSPGIKDLQKINQLFTVLKTFNPLASFVS